MRKPKQVNRGDEGSDNASLARAVVTPSTPAGFRPHTPTCWGSCLAAEECHPMWMRFKWRRTFSVPFCAAADPSRRCARAGMPLRLYDSQHLSQYERQRLWNTANDREVHQAVAAPVILLHRPTLLVIHPQARPHNLRRVVRPGLHLGQALGGWGQRRHHDGRPPRHQVRRHVDVRQVIALAAFAAHAAAGALPRERKCESRGRERSAMSVSARTFSMSTSSRRLRLSAVWMRTSESSITCARRRDWRERC